MSEQTPAEISWERVDAFRLARHHLSHQRPSAALTSAAADMAGAQAQLLPAAEISLWARVKGAKVGDVESAIWKDHTLVKAWCMRRTLFLLPSSELAIFTRGTTRRAAYHLRYALSRIGSEKELNELLDHVLEALKEPRTRADLAQTLSKSHGYKIKSKPGGGWGNRSQVPWVELRKASIPVGQLFHIIAARHVICSGPGKGNESAYVRADKWIPEWKDVPIEKAEKELLIRYLRSFGPATLTDFALWAGMYVRDVKEIWAREADNIVNVDVEGWKSSILRSDLTELKEAEIDRPVVCLLPFFDSFLLG
ncbi:AlkZ family DNA glycosylase, partial [Candidatus Bathyarchaeota archaeon]|nr:AlkZ family DNA glycosylase [Candidatus Bathyarchaeota archaeon]